MRRPSYRAAPQDGKDILRILESSAAKGNIELLYTRRPDAYESYMKEVGEARVFVSKDGARTVGTCAELIREVYIGGEIRKAAYICGLKKDAAYDGGVGFDGRLIRELQRDDIDYYYCSVVMDNAQAQRMFEKRRRILSMKPIAQYRTYIFSVKVKPKTPKHTLVCRQATANDAEALLRFLNREGKKKDLFPVISAFEAFENLACEDFYLLLDGDRIVATVALWNQTGYKQYVVKRYGGFMRLGRLFNPLLAALGYIKLPKTNEPLCFPMLSFFLCENDHADYARILLKEIGAKIGPQYGMFVIGIPRDHFAAPILDKLPSVHFDTKLYGISFPWSERPAKEPDPKRLYPECGLM